jgi:lysine/ornithine N-monooxygenase
LVLASGTRKTWIYIQYAIKGPKKITIEKLSLLCFRSARAWHSLLAERHTEKRKVLEEKKVDYLL